ncbi:MAG: hypothetical protein OIN83_07480 [Candidatus Methanoperedens sp.]|nr:hypothetical protein [Candidatus Methanoperedens sp.]
MINDRAERKYYYGGGARFLPGLKSGVSSAPAPPEDTMNKYRSR